MTGRPSVEDVLRILDLDRLGPDRWRGGCVSAEGPVVFGGQLVGQAVVAAVGVVPGKRVRSVHTIFARTGRTDTPVDFVVEPLHDGRSFASLSVTAEQGGRRLARSLLLLGEDQDDVLRHATEVPATGGPGAAFPRSPMLVGWDQRFVEDVDLFDPAAVGPPQLRMWSRFDTHRAEPAVACALLAWASVGSFIGTAMRPHRGVGLAIAHRELSTGVISHTVTFHETFAAGEWLLLDIHSRFAGGGMTFGTADVFTEDGQLVASCSQEAMVRRKTAGSTL